MLTHVAVDLDILPNELDFGIRVLHQRCQTLLDGLDLLGYRTENTLFKSIKLVETAPCPYLTETNEDTTHGLEVERLVTAED